jgi:hypothetical protein
MMRKIGKTAARMAEERETVSVQIGPPRKSSADWLFSLRTEAVRKGGRLRFVTRRRFVSNNGIKGAGPGGNGNGTGSVPAGDGD